jgi:NAD(P)H-nitrite reductase large subunit
MLKLGEKGTILQKDGATYAIAPHIPCGLVTPDLLRKLADVAEKYGAKAMKITGATRIALVGLQEKDIDAIWQELAMTPGAAVGLCVRSVRACPGNRFCKLGQQDALAMGMQLDERYHGLQLPGKFKIAVSGCRLNCAESWVRDIGLVGAAEGWILLAGGNVGAKPRIAQELGQGFDDEATLAAVARVVDCYRENAKKGERLGKMIERLGTGPLETAMG